MEVRSRHKVLLVDDERLFHSAITGLYSESPYQFESVFDGVAALNAMQRAAYELVILDINIPRVSGIEVLQHIKDNYPTTEVIMLTAVHDIKVAVECMKLGAFYYLTKPFSTDELSTVVSRAFERRRMLVENSVLQSKLERIASNYQIIGQSPALQETLEIATKVAPTESTVLLQGASGTGKELIAHHIHEKSLRADKPIIAINCASIPDTLIESELFGHERGAFTDAKGQKHGLVEIANGGTLFLDEIADVSIAIQPKLLRFIQSGEFRRVGGNVGLQSDVRIISATNKDLRDEVRAGRFREDLFYRLNVITLQMPSLADRREDIPLLAEHFLCHKIRLNVRKTIAQNAIDVLTSYSWPGNIRELENVLERAAIVSKSDIIGPSDLLLPHPSSAYTETLPDVADEATLTLREMEKIHIAKVLQRTSWNKNLAAGVLDISLKTLYTKISAFGLKK